MKFGSNQFDVQKLAKYLKFNCIWDFQQVGKKHSGLQVCGARGYRELLPVAAQSDPDQSSGSLLSQGAHVGLASLQASRNAGELLISGSVYRNEV